MSHNDPATLIQRQLDAYNAKDVDAWLATYAPDAEQRFAEPNLHDRLLSRVVMGAEVVDLEEITRNFPEGRGTVQMLCIYVVADGLIAKASFSTSAPRLERAQAAIHS